MRNITKLMNGWYFTGRDSVRTAVDLPHTWNAKDGQDGGDDYYRGTCVYDCVVKDRIIMQGKEFICSFTE